MVLPPGGTVPFRLLAGLGYRRRLEQMDRLGVVIEVGPMPRKPRGIIVRSFVHITAKGNRGVPLYHRDSDYRFFLSCLRDYAARDAVRVHAFCLLGNHFHLLVEATDTPVSKMMHTLLHRYAQYVNRIHRYWGHLFGDRFWARVCTEEYDVLSVLRYVHLNPLRAGLVRKLELYPWSSHRIYLGITGLPWVATTILQSFHADRNRAVAAYAEFVADGARFCAHRGQDGHVTKARSLGSGN